jgi:hypothetical protein
VRGSAVEAPSAEPVAILQRFGPASGHTRRKHPIVPLPVEELAIGFGLGMGRHPAVEPRRAAPARRTGGATSG